MDKVHIAPKRNRFGCAQSCGEECAALPNVKDGMYWANPTLRFLSEQTPANPLLAFAADLVVPVDESALRIIAPGPDMQLEKIIQGKAVRRRDELEILAVELRRCSAIVRQPRGRIHAVLDAHQ